jgi:transposase-like protein
MNEVKERYWLLLEKSDETRISKGIDGYRDQTGEYYRYDSKVPNHKQLSAGDYVVLRKEDDILGLGRISVISQLPDTKIHRRCPECKSTDVRERLARVPRWKCGKCSVEFQNPNETITEVMTFQATIADFTKLNSPPAVKAVKSCAMNGLGVNSQLSILELNPRRVTNLLEGVSPIFSPRTKKTKLGGQGFGLSREERRLVELYAMQFAQKLYEQAGWEVIDTSASQPYDFLARRANEERYIEVKGTTGEGVSIMLTHGEVRHVEENRNSCALVVVSKIILDRSGEDVIAVGGELSTHSDPWILDRSALQPTEYRYTL